MTFYDLHAPADVAGGPWAFNLISKLVAHPQFPVTRRTLERAVKAGGGYPVTVHGWRVEQRHMNPVVLAL